MLSTWWRDYPSYTLRLAPRNQAGIALVTVLALMGIISVLVAAYTLTIRADVTLRGGAARERAGFYAAEAGLNTAMAEVHQFFENQTPPGATYTQSFTVDSGSHQRTVEYQVAPVAGCSPAPPSLIPAGQLFAGLYTIPSEYTVSATAMNGMGDPEAALGSQFTINSIPLFQFMAYAENTLDVQNAPPMTVSGRIHSNGNLYLNTWSTLTIGDRHSPPSAPPDNPYVQISAAGNIYRGGIVNDCMGTVTIDKLEDVVAPTPDLDPLVLACTGTGPTLVDAAARAPFLGAVQAGVDPLLLPPVYTLERGQSGVSGGLAWQRADLRIVLNLTASRLVGANAFCGATLAAPGLYPIEVQNANGTRDTTKTNALWQFMCERRGAIFYNDIPTTSPAVMPIPGTPTPSDADDPSNPGNYTPPFAATEPDLDKRAARIYRRVGEDTNGDGAIDTDGDGTVENNDRNDDVCPIGNVTGQAGNPRPTWRPDYCDVSIGAAWPNDDPAAAPSSSWYLDNDYRRGGFYNWREEKWVMMLNVNIRALIDWNEAQSGPLFPVNDTSDGGLVFFLSVQAADSTTTPPPATRRYGVRIFDSANLNTRGGTFPRPNPDDPTGLTVVSDQAMHIQGNYNYYPAMTLATKLPAAVMGDTINILSQSWEVPTLAGANTLATARHFNNDRKSPQDRSPVRVMSLVDGYFVQNTGLVCATAPCTSFSPTNTFGINAAFLGNTTLSVPASGSNPAIYGGGLENYPRFFESWEPGGQAQSLTYAGSFVSLGIPRYEVGLFRGRGSIVYDPPVRNWDYDASFNNVKLLPPLTPMAELLQQRVFTRFYQ